MVRQPPVTDRISNVLGVTGALLLAMATGHPGGPSPEEAFAALGSAARTTLLHELAEADRPLSFSTLRRRSEIDDPGRLNYHLDQLRGTFVTHGDEGYTLTDRGRRIVTAVLAGAVTGADPIEPTPIDIGCTYCDATVEVAYDGERLIVACPACEGAFGDRDLEPWGSRSVGYIGSLGIPPAATVGRDAAALHHAAQTWGYQRFLLVANDLCPDCASPLEADPVVCADHEASDGLCSTCDRHYAVHLHSECPTCIFSFDGQFVVYLLSVTELVAFLAARGINFVAPEDNPWARFTVDEVVESTAPLRVSYTVSVGDDAISLTVDETLTVVDVEGDGPIGHHG